MTDPADAPASEWQSFPADVYLDQRHANWVIAEELGSVRFRPEGRIVLVHRPRAEHIVKALLDTAGQAPNLAGPQSSPPPRVPSVPARLPSTAGRQAARSARGASRQALAPVAPRRWRDLLGWTGIVAGVAVFVAALAIPLDDASLLLALALTLRGGRHILDTPGPTRRPAPAAWRPAAERAA